MYVEERQDPLVTDDQPVALTYRANSPVLCRLIVAPINSYAGKLPYGGLR